MRNRNLHDRLEGLAAHASERLGALLEAGAEVPYEVAENPGSRSVLYHYKPLSGQFLKERFGELRSIEGFESIVSALAGVEGTAAFLRAMGASYTPADERDRAEQVLRELLALVWDESTTFEFEQRSFDRAYQQFESIVYEDTVVNTVLAPLLGVRLAAERWEIGAGMTLVRGDLCEAPAEAVWASGRDDDEPNTLVVMTVESTPQDPPPLTAARLDFRRLLTALRLFKTGPATLGPSAWWRTDEGPWQSIPLGFAGRSRGGEYWLDAHEQGQFVELLELMRNRPVQGGSLAWALTRFELGLEQPVAIDGLSDHLLAIRALLDGGEPTSLAMAQRLAALCAEPDQRAELRGRIEQAFKLERLVMRGDVDSIYLEAVGAESPDRTARDLERALRALLRDMVCGHVGLDVREVADEMLGVSGPTEETGSATDAEPPLRAHRISEPKTEPVLEDWDQMPTEPVDEPGDAPEPRFVAKRTSAEKRRTSAGDRPTEETAPVPGARELRGEDDVDDWGFGDDPADYSAAI
ncbi:MAG: hypothetical protein WDZ37_05220 [Solirubrobacterales bacterium]